MLQATRVVFFVLLGVAFVLFALWSHLRGASAILAVVVGAAMTYLGLLSGFAWKDKDAWQRRAVETIVTPVIGTSARAAVACVVALLANVAAIWLLVQPRRDVTITVAVTFDEEAPAWTKLEQEPFTYSITLPSAEAAAPDPVSTTETSVTFDVPPMGDDRKIVVEVDHDAFDPASFTGTIAEAAGNVIIDLEPKPILVVRLKPAPSQQNRYAAQVYRVDQDGSAPANFDAAGRLIWIVNMSEDWLVDLVDREQSRTFRSPIITITQKVKSHEIDIGAIGRSAEWADADSTRKIAVTSMSADAPSIGGRVSSEEANRFLYGGLPANTEVMVREGYVVSYNPELKIPNWVGYKLTPRPDVVDDRYGIFRADPNIPAAQSAVESDYSRSGYVRGHLVSERDMRRFGEQAVREAGFLSAVAPQTMQLNAGPWLTVEQWARDYVADSGKWVCVAAGPAFLNRAWDEGRRKATTIGEGQVGVPTHFWRVHTRLVDGKPDVLCVLMRNQSDVSRDVTEHLVSLGEVERIANVRFFPDLPEESQPDRAHVPTALW